MDVFRKLDKINDSELHPKFKLLRDEYYYFWARKIIEEWVEDFVDRDNKITEEFQTSFHSSFWEFYLHAALKELNFKIWHKYNRPDYIVTSPDEFYIEAVVSEIKNDGRPEKDRTLDDQLSMLSPISTCHEFAELIDEAIVRHSNSILTKLKKYTGHETKGKQKKGYIHCNWVDERKPYIIALASYDQVNYGKEYIYSMMALLYGLYYDPEKKIFFKKQSIKKPGTNSEIEIGLFEKDHMTNVSAIIFCNTLTLGKLSSLSKSRGYDPSYVINIRYDFVSPHFKIHEVNETYPEFLLDGLYLFHNPNAKNILSSDNLRDSGVLHFTVDQRGLAMDGSYRPIVARYCDANGHHYKELIKATAASNYNETKAW